MDNGKPVGYWEAKYYKLKVEFSNTQRGLSRLVKKKQHYRDTARACIEAYRKGYRDGTKDSFQTMVPIKREV